MRDSPTSTACAPAALTRAASAAVAMPLSLTAMTCFGKSGISRSGQTEVGLEDGEITVVHADDFRVVADGAVEFGLVVYLEERVEPGGRGGVMQGLDLLVGQGADNDEDGTGARQPGLQDLDRVDHEILPQAGNGGAASGEVAGHLLQILDATAEELLVGQDGQGGGAGGAVAAGLVRGGDVFLDGTGRRANGA
jgi:hypothetical protein